MRINKVLILGIDALEHDLMKEMGFKCLKKDVR